MFLLVSHRRLKPDLGETYSSALSPALSPALSSSIKRPRPTSTEIMDEFGLEVKDIGVHSLQKGAASYISLGSTCAPPQVATNI